jgi:predicted permease
MGRIHMKRVVLGGLAAALVINVGEGLFGFLMKTEYESALRNLGVRLRAGAAAFLPIVWSFVIGVLSIWLYAAIRPRYGPGPKTALRAALAVWSFTSATFSIAMACLGLFPARLMAYGAVWSLAEVIVAMLVGAWIYRERDFPAISSPAGKREGTR